MGLRAAAVLCLTLATIAWPPPAAAQAFLDDYGEGIEAAEAGRWEEAERLMRRAIDAHPEESRRLMRYLHFRPYVPHLYLGLALAEQDRCTAAMESLAESERQGVVPELEEEHRLLRDARERCREHLAAEAEAGRRREELASALERARDLRAAIRALGPALSPPEREPGDGTDGAGEPDPDARTRDLAAAWRQGDPSLAERLEEVEADLERATAALGNRPGRPDVLDAIADLTRSVVTRLEGIRKEAELRREAVRSRRNAARERVVAARRRARELLAATSALAEGVDVVARRRSALDELVERTAAAERGTEHTLDELAAVERSLEQGIAALGAVAEPPPDLLVEAAGTWLDGQPRDVLQLLAEPPESEDDGRTEGEGGGPAEGGEGDRGTGGEAGGGGGGEVEGAPEGEAAGESPLAALDERARAHALLLRAAAAFDLFHAGGGQQPELLERARRDARECRRLAPSLTPVPRAFSPRFRRFFDTVEPDDDEPASGTEEPAAADAPEARQAAGDDT